MLLGVDNAPKIDVGGDLAGGAVGEPCWVEGTVADTEGNPLGGAVIDVWEADGGGLYGVQYDDARMSARARARLQAGPEGEFSFWAIRPIAYLIPHDGPVGRMLEAVGRSPMRASHLHFQVTHPGAGPW